MSQTHPPLFNNVSINMFRLWAYRWLQTFQLAIEEINADPKLLPNVTLGFAILDSGESAHTVLEGVTWLLSGRESSIPNYQCSSPRPLAGVIGDASSSMSIPMARMLGLYRYPQISYFATLPLLSDRSQFPSFFRTIPSDEFQHRGLARLVIHFGWTWIGIIAVEDDYGRLGSQNLKKEIEKVGGCVAFSEFFPTTFSEGRTRQIIEVIRSSSAKAILVISFDSYVMPVLVEASRQNITGKVWVATDAWSMASSLTEMNLQNTLEGTIGFAIRRGEIPELNKFLTSINPYSSPMDIFIKEFWGVTFDCLWPPPVENQELETPTKQLCTGTENLKAIHTPYTDASEIRITYNVHNAVYALAHALHGLYSCQPGEGPFANGACAQGNNFEPWQLLYYLERVHFRKGGEEHFFDVQGNPPAVYDIVNWQMVGAGKMAFVTVGRFEAAALPGQDLILNHSTILWNGGSQQVPISVCSENCPTGHRRAARPGQPLCCFDCLSCSAGEVANNTDSSECSLCPEEFWSNEKRDMCIPKLTEFLSFSEPLGAALVAFTGGCSILVVLVSILFVKYHNTPIVKANNRYLSYLLLLALLLSFLCSFLFIGRPDGFSCLLRQVTFGLVFTFCVSCVLAKTIVVVVAFKATQPSRSLKTWTKENIPNKIIFISLMPQFLVCLLWLSCSPAFPEKNMASQPGKITIECNEGSSTAFWCMLGYMGFLAVASFLLAFIARKLPASFNEASSITFSMLIFISVWTSFLPAYRSTQGKYMVATEVFAILASSSALLVCLFFPKCYIILLKPKRNTREHLLGKPTHKNKK
ncbi:extracellular calcium-sensing receptor-like [Lissotriton helveticus]